MSTEGNAPPATCAWCGHVLTPDEEVCPGCGNRNPIFSRRARARVRAAERREARAQGGPGEAESSEGCTSVLGEGCVDAVLSGLFGGVVLVLIVTAVTRRAGRGSGARWAGLPGRQRGNRT